MIVLHLVCVAVGVAALVKSADWFVDAAVSIARRLHVPDLIVGVTLVSLATTLPEFAVSLLAAFQSKAQIAVGNAMGSMICNIGLILGLCTLLMPIRVVRRNFLRNGLWMVGLTGLFVGLGYYFPDGSRHVGAIMLTALVIYMGRLVWTSIREREAPGPSFSRPMPMPKAAGLFLLGTVGVIGGSQILIYGAEGLARSAGLPDLVIAVTLVALGTSMPELSIALAAILKKQRALSVGNVIGANILNLAWVVGAASLVSPLPLERQTLLLDLPLIMVLTVLLLIFGLTGQRLARREGAVLLTLYGAYIVLVFMVFR